MQTANLDNIEVHIARSITNLMSKLKWAGRLGPAFRQEFLNFWEVTVPSTISLAAASRDIQRNFAVSLEMSPVRFLLR